MYYDVFFFYVVALSVSLYDSQSCLDHFCYPLLRAPKLTRDLILTDATKTKKRIGKKYPYAQAPNVEFYHSA